MSGWLRFPNRVLLSGLTCLVLAAPVVSFADEPAAPSAGERLAVEEIRLDNGLRIFVLERPTVPTFTGLYQFRVGGAFDPKGRSGIAHLLEHMMFKGTESVGILDRERERVIMERLSKLWARLDSELEREDAPFEEADQERISELREEIEKLSAEHKKLIVKNEYDEIMTRAGGNYLNASTSHDATTYFVELPSNRLEFWFQVESDRLLDPVFREFYSERDVVREERRLRYENRPSGMLYEGLLGLIFRAHPYGRPNIGWPDDVERLRREDAESYFETYYSPSNCIMVLTGDVRTKDVERLAKKYFGSWKRQEVPPLKLTEEPEQRGERREIIEFDAEPQVRMGWRTVPVGHPDEAALEVLAKVLGGLYSSRLDQALVQKERIASSVYTGNAARQHAGYFLVSGVPRGEHTTAELEKAVDREIGRIKDDGVTEEELERAKIQVEAARVRRLKSNLGQAFRIATAVRVSGGTDYLEEEERRINAVTAEQVRDVARRYLEAARRSVVELRKNPEATVPEGGGGAVAHQRGSSPGPRGQKHSAGFERAMATIRAAEPIDLEVPEIGKDVDRVELPSGITVFVKEDHTAPSVEMAFAWTGGSNTTPVEELAPLELAADLLTEGGTGDLDPMALQQRKDALGMSFRMWVGSTMGGASVWSLRRNFDESFDLVVDMITRPRLDASRLDTIRGQYIERMKRRYESPGYGAYLVEQHVFFHDKPRLGYVASRKQIEAVTPADVRAVWKRYLGRDNLYVTVVGDFDKDEMVEVLEKRLGGWRRAEETRREWIRWDPVKRPGVYLVNKDLPQPAIRIGHQIDVDRTAPMKDHAAIEILNDILGGSGFRSRLMERLRSDEGLTYGIYSSISHEGRPGVPGSVRVSYQTRRDAVARSMSSVVEEINRIIAEKVSAAEVEEQIEAWRNRFVFRYDDDFYSVSRLMYNELDDRPYDYDRQELEAVQKVRVSDVKRVAEEYLDPESLVFSIYGTLTDEDRSRLSETYSVKVLPREKVFTGGYETETEEPEGGAGVEERAERGE